MAKTKSLSSYFYLFMPFKFLQIFIILSSYLLYFANFHICKTHLINQTTKCHPCTYLHTYISNKLLSVYIEENNLIKL